MAMLSSPRDLGLGASVCAIALLGACAQKDSTALPAENLLLIVVDDVGLDSLSCYGGTGGAETPTLDRIAASGVRFDTVWSEPMCSPTRATIMTGKYSFRAGVTGVVRRRSTSGGLSTDHRSLANAIRTDRENRPIRSAFLGKWHLAAGSDWPGHVGRHGFEHFRGTFGNLGNAEKEGAYSEYDEWIDEEPAVRKQYATSAVVDDTLAAIAGFGDDPWFAVASFHAAHVPFHTPPSIAALDPADGNFRRAQYIAMVEVLDSEIGRLLDELGSERLSRTHVVIVADNGSPKLVHDSRETGRRAKGSLFEGGICVPLLIQGPRVSEPGRLSSALVNTTDIFATCVELMTGAAPSDVPDSVSLVPVLRDAGNPGLRSWIAAERFRNEAARGDPLQGGSWAVRSRRYKYIERRDKGTAEFYDLESDPGEQTPLDPNTVVSDKPLAALGLLRAALGEIEGR